MKLTAEEIRKVFQQQLNNMNAGYDQAATAAGSAYQTAADRATADYAALNSSAATQNTIAQALQKNRLASLGVQDAAPLTLTNNAAMAQQNVLGNITQQKNLYGGELMGIRDMAKANLAAAKLQQQAAQQENENAALMNLNNAMRTNYYNMLLKKKITAKQFKNLTGIPIHAFRSRRGPKTGGDLFSRLKEAGIPMTQMNIHGMGDAETVPKTANGGRMVKDKNGNIYYY